MVSLGVLRFTWGLFGNFVIPYWGVFSISGLVSIGCAFRVSSCCCVISIGLYVFLFIACVALLVVEFWGRVSVCCYLKQFIEDMFY